MLPAVLPRTNSAGHVIPAKAGIHGDADCVLHEKAPLSYVHGASDTPFIGDTIGVYFDRMVERFGERPALIVCHQQIRWSYAELKQRVDSFAAGLLALGLKRGDRIGIWSPNNAEWVITQFATAKAGLILVNINPAYRLAELEYALNKVGCKALVTATALKTSDYIAMLNHHNILNNGFFIGETMRLTEKDRICIPVPLYHCFGMVLGNLACITHGSAMVYPGDAFDPLAVLETVQAERCTGLYGVPTMFIAELGHAEFKRFDLSTLRTGIMAGSPCPTEVMKRVNAEMHMSEVTICYGMTETSPVSFQTAADDPLEKRVGSVGRIHPHVEVKIVDAEGRVVPPGTPGELCTRGYSVMQGYWNDAEKTAEAIDAGRWMHTGDLATLDEDGYCNIVGRIKDMVIRGGENIYPREIEEFLYRHPKVQEVQVFGVPDGRYGEELCAWIRLREGMTISAEELKLFCKDQIAHF